MLLSIYDLEDSSGRPLCSFGQGEHVIGRGSPLKCADKRISRKHAQIEVSDNVATITAKHQINPCFYRAAEGKHISILKYDVPVELNDDDKFGFFPDKNWFRIKLTNNNDISNEENLNESTGSRLAAEECSQNNTTINESSPSKREKFVISERETDNACSSSRTKDESSVENNEIINTINEQRSDVNEENSCKNKPISETNQSEIEPNNPTNEVPANLENTPVNNPEEDIVQSNNLPVLNNPEENIVQSNNEVDNILPVNEIKQENISYNEDGLDVEQPSIHSAETSRDENELPPELPEVKEEVDGQNTGNCGNVKVKNEPPDYDVTAPSSNNNTSNNTGKVYRDRCWYGDNCYRKNDEHRLKFSHPNDKDYDTDPDDPRPSCSYGGNCYRRNKDHRKNFKHSRFSASTTRQPPPAQQTPSKNRKRRSVKKENKSDDGDDLSQSNIVGTKRRRKNKNMTESPLDDYDAADPFIDDSEDEFVMDTDESESDEDSQSQNV